MSSPELSFEDLKYWDLEVNNPDVFYATDEPEDVL